jgi:3-dehydroquinate dehydratase-2
MHLLLLNGPNMNLLGEREPDRYGRQTLGDLEAELSNYAEQRGAKLRCAQTNHEGELIELIQQARTDCAGIIINPAGYGHSSVALRDAILAVALPTIEVHLTNIAGREPFRQKTLIADVVLGRISGFGVHGYRLAIDGLLEHLNS